MMNASNQTKAALKAVEDAKKETLQARTYAVTESSDNCLHERIAQSITVLEERVKDVFLHLK